MGKWSFWQYKLLFTIILVSRLFQNTHSHVLSLCFSMLHMLFVCFCKRLLRPSCGRTLNWWMLMWVCFPLSLLFNVLHLPSVAPALTNTYIYICLRNVQGGGEATLSNAGRSDRSQRWHVWGFLATSREYSKIVVWITCICCSLPLDCSHSQIILPRSCPTESRQPGLLWVNAWLSMRSSYYCSLFMIKIHFIMSLFFEEPE